MAPPTATDWALTIQALDGKAYLLPCRMTRTDDGEQTLKAIQECLKAAAAARPFQRLLTEFFTRDTAGITEIKQVLRHRSRRSPSVRVFLEDFTYDAFLTDVLHDPALLRGDFDYQDRNTQLVLREVRNPEALAGQKTIVVSRRFHKARFAWFLVLLLHLSPAMGVAAGIWSQRADVGVAVSAGIFALAGILQVLVAWFLK